ncbi:unnamed protein product [Cyprideis torosa]|uniref:RING-type E3 ubiquitin transferase n=1 Tax=Cyprideis torosa TaxID=163714 RepID=A0A7R8WJ64_9CRUS|nr:unnamed protein product [Cyprideis torosa]CAG0901607.1 unnamed protein product [Cyprideis torosa]
MAESMMGWPWPGATGSPISLPPSSVLSSPTVRPDSRLQTRGGWMIIGWVAAAAIANAMSDNTTTRARQLPSPRPPTVLLSQLCRTHRGKGRPATRGDGPGSSPCKMKPKNKEKGGDTEPLLSPKEWKEKGNKFFLAKKYDDAVLCYTQAIRKEPSVATYFTNRALAYLKVRNWTAACKDCRMAMDLDPTSVKAHYFMSQALIEVEQFEEAIQHLQRGE